MALLEIFSSISLKSLTCILSLYVSRDYLDLDQLKVGQVGITDDVRLEGVWLSVSVMKNVSTELRMI